MQLKSSYATKPTVTVDNAISQGAIINVENLSKQTGPPLSSNSATLAAFFTRSLNLAFNAPDSKWI
jgi:hypothetical protein